MILLARQGENPPMSTVSRTSPADALELNGVDADLHIEDLLGYRIRILDGLLAQHAKQITRQTVDMNRAEWFMLLEVGKAKGVSPHEVARHTGMERSHVTAAMRALIERSLVTSTRDPSDGRRVHLSLTPKGRALLRRGADAYAPRRAVLSAALTVHEKNVLDQALAKLIHAAEQLLEEQRSFAEPN